MKAIALAAALAVSFAANAQETIGHILNVKTGQTTVRLLRDTIVAIKGVNCTAVVEVENAGSVANLTNLSDQAKPQIGFTRYCGEVKGIDIENDLKMFAASNDVVQATTKSTLSEMIYISPENPPDKQCQRQVIDALEVTLPNGRVLQLQNGFDIPGTPTPATCAGLRN